MNLLFDIAAPLLFNSTMRTSGPTPAFAMTVALVLTAPQPKNPPTNKSSTHRSIFDQVMIIFVGLEEMVKVSRYKFLIV